MESPSEDFLLCLLVLSLMCFFLLFLLMFIDIVPFDNSVEVQKNEIVDCLTFNITELLWKKKKL